MSEYKESREQQSNSGVPVRITMFQWLPADYKKKSHRQRIDETLAYIKEHISDKTTDILSFPEHYLTTLCQTGDPLPSKEDRAAEEEAKKSLIKLFADIKVNAILTGNDFYDPAKSPANVAWFISKHGEILHTYHKQSLAGAASGGGEADRISVGPESSGYFLAPCTCQGDKDCQTHKIPIGIMICSDLENLKVVQNLLENEPKPVIVFGPACIPTGRKEEDIKKRIEWAKASDKEFNRINKELLTEKRAFADRLIYPSKDAYVVRIDFPFPVKEGTSMLLKPGIFSESEWEAIQDQIDAGQSNLRLTKPMMDKIIAEKMSEYAPPLHIGNFVHTATITVNPITKPKPSMSL